MIPTVGQRFQDPDTLRVFVVTSTGTQRARVRYEDDGTEEVIDFAYFDQPPLPA